MITSDRNIFIAAHVTKEVKNAISKAAYEKGMSVSHLIYALLKKELVDNENANNQ